VNDPARGYRRADGGAAQCRRVQQGSRAAQVPSGGGMRYSILAVCLVACALLCAPALGQRVQSVRVLLTTDASGIDVSLLSRLVELRPGARYLPEAAARDMQRLVELGLFSQDSPGPTLEAATNGVRVTYVLTPNPKVTGYRFEGSRSVSADRLSSALAAVFPLGLVFDASAGQRARDSLLKAYREAGLSAEVDLPAVTSAGEVVARAMEHRLNRVRASWIGPRLTTDAAIESLAALPRFQPIRLTALEDARARMLATGLLETCALRESQPNEFGLVDLVVEIKARSLPAPATAADVALIDPAAVAVVVKGPRPLRLAVPLRLSVPLTPTETRRLAASGSAADQLAAAVGALDNGDTEDAVKYATEGARIAGEAVAACPWWVSARCKVLRGASVWVPAAGDPALSSPDPVDGALSGFAVAEARLAELCESLGCRPSPPASMRGLAAALAATERATAADTSAYATAFADATPKLLGLTDNGAIWRCRAEIGELIEARETLRAFDTRILSAPEPLPSMAETAFGNPRLWRAVAAMREKGDAEAAYVLADLALGRSFAAAQPGGGTDPGNAYELGGPRAAAELAGELLAQVAASSAASRYPDLSGLRALAALLADLVSTQSGDFPGLIADPATRDPFSLLYAAVGEDGLLGPSRADERRQAAHALATALAGERSERALSLACLALAWGGDLDAARQVADRELLPRFGDSPDALGVDGLVRIKSADYEGAAATLRRAQSLEPDDAKRAHLSRLLGCTLVASGDRAGAVDAFGVR